MGKLVENIHFDTNLTLVSKPGHIITYTGMHVNLFEPNPDSILLEDIAHGLAHTARWNGQAQTFYSVAEHTIRVVNRVSKAKQRTALFHDAEEAFWGDIVSPLKTLLPKYILEKIVGFREVVFQKYNVPPIDDEVNDADKVEMYWDFENIIKNNRYVGLRPEDAKRQWLSLANIILKRK